MQLVRTLGPIVLIMLSGNLSAQQPQVVTVQQTDIKRIAGEVVQVRGSLLTLRHEDGSGREAYRIPRGASIRIKGEDIRLQDLQPGQKIRIYYKETTEGRVIVLTPPSLQRGPAVVVDDEAAEVSPLPEPGPGAGPETLPSTLPDTAGSLPLIGLLGVLFLGLGSLVRLVRRRLG